ncbi:ribonuclease P protein component [Pelagicoccus sp. NFK12]|uniref:Ribonuclease P protein component n=1 Tax=Pelagicoccus enzymogenes TaxID=2773457 RepID=A0A927F9P3_9BACT|nr:ribonuclease P protein component [Pelagicoccus enzymogenes]MBD5780894.1 ribonuclease P protein component [Pelagicoccus enzymogenes]MDQ8199932.1 ribonuclease P protein component [Pelagicoccus enzymogenes]
MVRRFKLRPVSRLRRNADFLQIRSHGKPYRCQYFALFSRIRAVEGTDVLCPRIGISAARRVGNAVTRNKIKRRFRELFRLHQHELRPEADIVLSLRQPAGKASYQELEQRFLHALKFKKLLKRNEAPEERSQVEE